MTEKDHVRFKSPTTTRGQLMSGTITTTQLLDFIVKVDKVSSHVTFKKVGGEYVIDIHCDWDDNNNFYTQTTVISEEGHSTWKASDYEFFTMDSVLDELVKKQEEKEMKRQKREELLSRLTDEEKELLGVAS